MAELGLNIYQVIQNELITREGTRQSLGLGFRLAILETQIQNTDARAHNNKLWNLHHAIRPIKALTPAARRAAKDRERKLLKQHGRDPHRAPKDPTMLTREEEVWAVAEGFPRTVREFKELVFEPGRVRGLMDFYCVRAYRAGDLRLVDVRDDEEGLREVRENLEGCMEELGMEFGLNWHKIGGLVLPGVGAGGGEGFGRPPSVAPGQFPPPPGHFGSPPPPRSNTYSI